MQTPADWFEFLEGQNHFKYEITKHIKRASVVNYNVCELLISSGSISTVKVMLGNNSKLIAAGLSVNFNWPPEERDDSFSLKFSMGNCGSCSSAFSGCTKKNATGERVSLKLGGDKQGDLGVLINFQYTHWAKISFYFSTRYFPGT